MTAFQVSPVISAVGSPAFVTLTFGDCRVRVSGDDASLQKFLEQINPPAAAPASQSPTGKLGFRCVFGGRDGYIPVNVQADPPGIATTGQIAQLEADISQRVGSPVVLLSILPITVSPVVRAELANPDAGQPDEPVPADDEQPEPVQ